MLDRDTDPQRPSIRSDLFHGTIYGLALSAILWTLVLSPPASAPAAILLLAVSSAAGLLEGRSRLLGRFTATYPFVLAGLVLFGPGTALLAGLIATLSRRFLGSGGRRGVRTRLLSFESSTIALATALAAAAWSLPPTGNLISGPHWQAAIWPVIQHATIYALVITLVARISLGITSGRWPLRPRSGTVLRGCLRTGFAACNGWVLISLFQRPDLRAAGVFLALILCGYAVHAARHARTRLARLHELKIAAVCNSVVQALTQLMRTKDADTQQHVRRVQRLCLEIGSRMRLGRSEMDALSAAALLHDIGKVAVPEQILSKPGRLTSSEMARMRVHPDVGAELLESIPFPYPVSPIVRHHHERWDGHGYPAGLEGKGIPLGARILAVVDSYDALTSDRPYRKALPGEDAIAFLQRESGKFFDPRIVQALLEYLEACSVRPPQALEPKTPEAPCEEPPEAEELPVRGCLPRAQQELRVLYDIRRAGEYDLSLDEYITLVACKLANLVPHCSLVIYFLDPDEPLLRAGFAIGEASDKLGLMTIPLGERISGWAARHQQACIGNESRSPLDRDGTRSDLEEWRDDDVIGALTSSIAAPINVGGSTLGVLTLYAGDERKFSADDRRVLVRVAGHLGPVVQRTREAKQRTETCLTDPLTGVPNARFLWLETAHRLSSSPDESSHFGLLAFRVWGLEHVGARLGHDETDRLLCRLARRFAASCADSETLVRFGDNLFTVLTPILRGGELVSRWHDIARDVQEPTMTASDGAPCKLRLSSAHASCPEDGDDLEALLETLDTRLGLAQNSGAAVLPFRPQQQAAELGS